MSDQHEITPEDWACADLSDPSGHNLSDERHGRAYAAMLARTAAFKPVDPDLAEAEKLAYAWHVNEIKDVYGLALAAIKRGRALAAEASAPKKPAARDPEVGSIWQHYNGNRYQVIAIANQLDTEKYPKSVVHQNIRNKFVSVRRADDWHRSHTYLGHWQGDDVATDSDLSKSEELRKELRKEFEA